MLNQVNGPKRKEKKAKISRAVVFVIKSIQLSRIVVTHCYVLSCIVISCYALSRIVIFVFVIVFTLSFRYKFLF